MVLPAFKAFYEVVRTGNFRFIVFFSPWCKFETIGTACRASYYEFVGDIVEAAGGTVVKFIADGGLIEFPSNRVDKGVLALKNLKEKGDCWLSSRGFTAKNIVKAHVGSVVCGAIGTKSDKRFDVFGPAVNTTALLRSNGLALSQQLFRKLKPETRTFFKKHTPPVTYIPVEEKHRE